MKTKNEDDWQKQLADFASDGDPMAEYMPGFITTWCDKAEALMELGSHDPDDTVSPMNALRGTLRATEKQHGRLTIAFLGMAIILISQHWEYSGDQEEFGASLTTIEQNLYFDVAAFKLLQLSQQAEQELQTDG